MAVAFDARTNIAQTTSTLTTTHTPVGTPRGAIVYVVQTGGNTDEVTGATYGGVAMTQLSGSPALTAGPPTRAVYAFFLGASIPAGAQTVTVNVNATGSNKFATVATVTAAGDTSVSDIGIINPGGTDPTVLLEIGGVAAWCSLAFWNDANGVAGTTPFTNWTDSNEQDFGADSGGFYRYNTVDTVDVTAGYTSSSASTAIAVAIREGVAAGGGVPVKAKHYGMMRAA